jgi:hypothetical protein
LNRTTVLPILAPLLLLSIILAYPLGSDNSVYHSMALEWVKYGKPPYLGSWDQNFPGIILFHAISILLFGASDLGFRFLDLLIQIAGCFVLYRLWSLYFRPRTAWMAVLLYIFYYVHSSSMVIGQRDVYATLAVLSAITIILRFPSLTISRLFAIGLLFGFAVLMRPTYAMYEVAAVALLPSLRRPKIAASILLISGLPCATVIMLYALIPEGVHQLYLATIQFNLDLYSHFGWRWSWWWRGLLRTLVVIIPIALLLVLPRRACAATSISIINPMPPPVKLLYYTYIILTLLLTLVQGKFLTYHFYPYVLLLTPLAALGFETFFQFIRLRYQIPAFLAIGLIAVLPIEKIRFTMEGLSKGYSFPTALYAAEYPGEETGYIAALHAKQYLKTYVAKGDRIEVATFDARLRASLGANSATRFTMVTAIGCRIDPKRTGEDNYTSYQHEWRREYMDSLRSVQPLYIVLARKTDFWYMNDPYDDVLHGLPGFDSLLAGSYRYVTAFGAYQIFRRK